MIWAKSMESTNPGDKPQDPIVDLGQEREEAKFIQQRYALNPQPLWRNAFPHVA